MIRWSKHRKPKNSSRSTKPTARRTPFSLSPGQPATAFRSSPKLSTNRGAEKLCNYESPNSTSKRSANSPNRAPHWSSRPVCPISPAWRLWPPRFSITNKKGGDSLERIIHLPEKGEPGRPSMAQGNATPRCLWDARTVPRFAVRTGLSDRNRTPVLRRACVGFVCPAAGKQRAWTAGRIRPVESTISNACSTAKQYPHDPSTSHRNPVFKAGTNSEPPRPPAFAPT